MSNITTSVMVYAPGSPVYRSLTALPTLMLSTVMACRVYRNTRLVLTKQALGIPCSVALENIEAGVGDETTSVHFVCPIRERAHYDSEAKDGVTSLGQNVGILVAGRTADMMNGHSTIKAQETV